MTAEYFVVRGQVEKGDQRGRELGFPTANIALRDQDGQIGDGVWAGWAERADGTRIAAAVSVGRRPTYYGADGYRLVEAHLLDFAGDLYGETLTVWLGHHLREQEAYPSSEALIVALTKDIADAAAWAADNPAAALPNPGDAGDGVVRRVGA
ncbi:riboflavin kinase [Amycolatopsis orientalis]|uniref:riboflavin kinase n=1 Tax=Amycolatopsis orientalis TaxID=31958 RepID=A0A193BWK6_AMYOR|nr:riboflavin kinase [Amycolatopsis orientalis]ANN16560.1 riboflavin kinase [Amycolatopsis orientalis]